MLVKDSPLVIEIVIEDTWRRHIFESQSKPLDFYPILPNNSPPLAKFISILKYR